jgi:hypothetical protein
MFWHGGRGRKRRRAITALLTVSLIYGSRGESARGLVTYLIGELWRRIGDDGAKLVRPRAQRSHAEPDAQAWVLEVAQQQRLSPREWFV